MENLTRYPWLIFAAAFVALWLASVMEPLHAIDDAVEKIKDGTIANCIYDPKSARLNRMG
jgi:hypothetical protein